MSSFSECSAVEAASRAILRPYLRSRWSGRLFLFGRQAQLDGAGDIEVRGDGGFTIELKAERSNKYGNLFLETWSHRRIGREGWMRTNRADVLIYHFLAEGLLYITTFRILRRWFAANEHRYEEKLQKRHPQQNDTWGKPVPIKVLLADGAIVEIRL